MHAQIERFPVDERNLKLSNPAIIRN